MTETTNATPATPLTYAQKLAKRVTDLHAKIVKDTETYNALNAELAGIAAIENLQAGAAVTVKTGRKFADKDTTQIRDGVVLGVKVDDSGKRSFKVQVGAGFEADVVVVDSSAITVKPVEASEDSAAAAVTSDSVA